MTGPEKVWIIVFNGTTIGLAWVLIVFLCWLIAG